MQNAKIKSGKLARRPSHSLFSGELMLQIIHIQVLKYFTFCFVSGGIWTHPQESLGALILLEVSYVCGIIWELNNGLLLGRWQKYWGCQERMILPGGKARER